MSVLSADSPRLSCSLWTPSSVGSVWGVSAFSKHSCSLWSGEASLLKARAVAEVASDSDRWAWCNKQSVFKVLRAIDWLPNLTEYVSGCSGLMRKWLQLQMCLNTLAFSLLLWTHFWLEGKTVVVLTVLCPDANKSLNLIRTSLFLFSSFELSL